MKEYTNGEVTIVWKPKVCIHSKNCVNGLPNVFRPKEKPWIDVEAADTDALVSQVKKCPSGALSYYMNGEKNTESENTTMQTEQNQTEIEVVKNGPLMVKGTVCVKHHDGTTITKEKKTWLCRCGSSSNKPYCDGTHNKIGFEG